MSKLTDADFELYLQQTRAKLGTAAFIAGEKDINYGRQFTLKRGDAKVTLNIYSGRKGLNLVYSGDQDLTAAAQAALGSDVPARANADERTDGVGSEAGLWAGSDESGKGDFFGSLAVAAVALDASAAAQLRLAGVKDCKLLSDKRILELENNIKSMAVDYSVLELKPRVYNLRYEQVAADGGKLNQLLGYGHVAALSQVLVRHPDCRRVLIDQFAASTASVRELSRRFAGCQVRQQPRAESDLAVAAASVLARARFLRTMEELAAAAGVDCLPKGGGCAATECARQLARKFGKAALRDYVKLHFANYQRL